MSDKGCRVGVIVREPAAEQLRMAVGLTSIHNSILVVIADHVIEPDEMTQEHIEALRLLGARLLTNRKDNPFEYMDDNGISAVLAECEVVLS